MGGVNHEVMEQIIILKIYLLGIEEFITTTNEQIGRLLYLSLRPRDMRGSAKSSNKILSFLHH